MLHPTLALSADPGAVRLTLALSPLALSSCGSWVQSDRVVQVQSMIKRTLVVQKGLSDGTRPEWAECQVLPKGPPGAGTRPVRC